MKETILRIDDTAKKCGFSRSMVWAKLNPNNRRHDETFPKPIKLSERAVGWLESEFLGAFSGCLKTPTTPKTQMQAEALCLQNQAPALPRVWRQRPFQIYRFSRQWRLYLQPMHPTRRKRF